MIRLEIEANNPEELRYQILGYLCSMKGIDFEKNGEKIDTSSVYHAEEIKPVLTQEEQKQNVEKAPEHTAPPQPTVEEVRKALLELKARKGSGAVKTLLKAFGAENLTELKPEDYLGALDRANTEV